MMASLDDLLLEAGADNNYNTDEIIRLHASILHKDLPDGFLSYLFMLNGEKSFDYPYTLEDKKLVKSVFQSIISMETFNIPYMIYPLLFRVLHDVMGVDSYSDKNVLVSVNDSEFVFMNNIYTISYLGETDINSINVPVNGVKWMNYSNGGSIIMNLEPKQCMLALKKIVEYGLEDILNLEAYVTAIGKFRPSEKSIKDIDVNKQEYRMAIKRIVNNNNHEAYRVLLIFLQLIKIRSYELECPSYYDLLRLSHTPSHIIQTNIESGDFSRPIRRKRVNLSEMIESSKPDNRRREVFDLIDKINRQNFGFHYFDKLIDNAYRLMNLKYKKNWEALQDSTVKYNNSYMLGVLPWDGRYNHIPRYYQPLYASQIMLEIVSSEIKTKRLKTLWETRGLMQQLWIKVNGNGFVIDNNSLAHYDFYPRRYWDEDNREHSLSKFVIKDSSAAGTYSKNYMPPELFDYIRTGRPPETITSDSYWSAYLIIKTEGKYDIDCDYPNNDALSEYECNKDKHMVFKLRTPETEDEWQDWACALESQSI